MCWGWFCYEMSNGKMLSIRNAKNECPKYIRAKKLTASSMWNARPSTSWTYIYQLDGYTKSKKGEISQSKEIAAGAQFEIAMSVIYNRKQQLMLCSSSSYASGNWHSGKLNSITHRYIVEGTFHIFASSKGTKNPNKCYLPMRGERQREMLRSYSTGVLAWHCSAVPITFANWALSRTCMTKD